MLLNTWHHLVGVRRGTTNELWFNGVQKATGTASVYAVNTAGKLYIGQFTHGLMDEVRIYNRALSAKEVKALYNLEKPKEK